MRARGQFIARGGSRDNPFDRWRHALSIDVDATHRFRHDRRWVCRQHAVAHGHESHSFLFHRLHRPAGSRGNFTMLVDQVRHAGVATSVVTSATDVTGSTWICKPDQRVAGESNSVLEDHDEDQLHRRDPFGAEPTQLDSEPDRATPGAAEPAQQRDDLRHVDRLAARSREQVVTPAHPATGIDKAWHDSSAASHWR